ncbi:MAG: DUF4421 domain-containing protein [Cytophagaceae bacterium]|nr:DUF4421 domain-containing protein [Cytophagaceae bacterium]
MLLIISARCIAQIDSSYILPLHDKFIVKPFLGAPQFNMELNPAFAPDSVNSDYTANTIGLIGIDLSYRSASLSLSKRVGQFNDEKVYGKTKYSQLSGKFGLHNFSFEGYFKKYKGFADLNTPSYHKTPSDSFPYLIRNDLEIKYYKVKGIYQFSMRKFSYPAAFSFTERQRRSAAGLFMMVNVNRFLINADSSFIPFPVQQDYKEQKSISELKVTTMGIAPGASFNLVWRKLFFAGILFLGAEVQHQKYFLTEDNQWKTNWRIAPLADSRFSLGVNGNRAFIAITVKNDFNYISLTRFNAKTTHTATTLDFGYRFNAPKVLVKTYDKIFSFLHKVIRIS